MIIQKNVNLRDFVRKNAYNFSRLKLEKFCGILPYIFYVYFFVAAEK